MLRKLLFGIAIISFFATCTKDPHANYEELDLLSYGFPVK